MKRVIALLTLVAAFSFCEQADAESAADYAASTPLDIQTDLLRFNSCAVVATIDAEKQSKGSIALAKRIVIKACGSLLANTPPIYSQRMMYIYFHNMSLRMRHLPVPGEVEDPWVTGIMKCDKAMTAFIRNYSSCTHDMTHKLTPLSDETTDNLAGTIGKLCYIVREAFTKSAACENADDIANKVEKERRKDIVADIVIFRAAARNILRKPKPPAAISSPSHGTNL